jgi:hypothetical protein
VVQVIGDRLGGGMSPNDFDMGNNIFSMINGIGDSLAVSSLSIMKKRGF